MQPFQAMDSPSSESTMGWAPASVRSMIFRRRWPSATRPCDHTPAPSGPLGAIASAMAATAVTSGFWPSRRTSPVAPHTPGTLPQLTRRKTCGDVRFVDPAGSGPLLGDTLQLLAGLVDL